MTDKTNQPKTISLVLGSGGARGLAHIGVIRWLEEKGYEIKSIAGCSIGSLIGGAYAAGKLDELEAFMLNITKTEMTSLLDFSWGSGGMFKGDRMIEALIKVIGAVQIEDLKIPFTAVAADVVNEKEVWINSGSLFDAIRASVSLPLFFTPVQRGDAVLVDGGVLNPVPIAPTFNDNTDLTIAVNLGGPINNKLTLGKKELQKEDKEEESLMDKMTAFISSLGKEEAAEWSMYKVADKAFDTMQNAIAKLKIAAYPPDMEIQIARNACGTMDFDKAKEMIALGYERAQLTYEVNKQLL